MVPVINLESNLASNPKLSTAGVLSSKDPSLATIEDSGQANKVQQCEENLDQIFESSGTCDHDFTLKDNDKAGWTEVPSKIFSPETTRIIKESHATMLNKENPMIKPHSERNDKSLVKETSDSRWADVVEEEEHAPTRGK
ncbi:hypothetical protein R3W88_002047 [Solanum pinnatisectum]|uniref:Uncharacterized protein n=1 Tax=Solanum pinnatisectum TaxID=50273 RepID=A0AAV9MND2_9SOLN|nr:hypothetical protein R3W88_002047 [Solanum pinnatisectum]